MKINTGLLRTFLRTVLCVAMSLNLLIPTTLTARASETTPPVLTITGATADGVDMAGSLSAGYILNTTNVPSGNHLIQFKSGTSADETLAGSYFGLNLIASTVSPTTLKAYYDARGVPEPYLTYLKAAVDGTNPFVYIMGTGSDSSATLVDAAKHDIAHADFDMTVPDDYPLGTYTVSGFITDLAGNPTTVTLILVVAGDRTGPVLTITGATADGVDMASSHFHQFILNTTNVPSGNHLIQFKSGTSADETLAGSYFGLSLIASTVSPTTLKAYYDARGVPEPYLNYLKAAVDGTNPFVYIMGTGSDSSATLVDAAKHDIAHADFNMAIPDDYPLGTYTVSGFITDLAGNPTTVTLKLVVAGDRTGPVLTITGATADGVDMAGSLSAGYILNTTNVPSGNHLIQFKSGTSADETLAGSYFGLSLIASSMSHDALKAYYASHGLPADYLAYLDAAVDGTNPFVYIMGTGSDSSAILVDAAKHDIAHADFNMAIPDDFPRGTYTVSGMITDLAGNPTTVTLILVVAGHRAVAIADDYDGDGKTDPAKFIASAGSVWWLKSSTSLWDGKWLGPDTFTYAGASDFDGDGKTDPAKFYPATGTVWWVKSTTGLLDGQWLGPDLFTYITGSDFDGDGQTDPAKFYPATGTVWWVKSTTGTLDGQWLGPDLFTYITGSDFDGDGKTDPAKFYPATGTVWWVKSTTGTIDGMWLGPDTFTYVSASDFDGDGKTDPAKFYPATGTVWWVKSSTHTMDGVWLGSGTFTYVAGCDFDGDGKTDPAKYDTSTHTLSWLKLGTGIWTNINLGTGTYTLAIGQ